MRRTRTLILVPLFIGLSLVLPACTNSESPTGPDSRPALHLVGLNASSSNNIWLHRWVAGEVQYPVELLPGSSVEFNRWYAVGAVRGAPFLVFRPSTSAPIPFSPWAEVQYNLGVPSGSLTSDLTVNVRLSIEPSGSLSVTSDRPDVFQVVQISYPSVWPGAS